MSDYTPNTGIVKAAYMVHMSGHERIEHKDAATEFDRWIAEHDRQIAETAWEEGATTAYYYAPDGYPETNPYR